MDGKGGDGMDGGEGEGGLRWSHGEFLYVATIVRSFVPSSHFERGVPRRGSSEARLLFCLSITDADR